MLRLLANPGVFNSAQTVDWTNKLIALLGLAIMVAVMLFIYVTLKSGKEIARKLTSWTLIVQLSLGFLLGAGVLILGVQSDSTLYDQAHAKYNSSVANWLATDYGIKASPKNAQLLVNGESFVTTYQSKTVTVSILKNLSGDLTVVDKNHMPLKHIK